MTLTVTSVDQGIHLPNVPDGLPQPITDYLRALDRGLRTIFYDRAQRDWALETTVGIAPRKPKSLALSYAPVNADYLVKTANSSLTAERVVTDTTEIYWDWATAGVAKAYIQNTTVVAGSYTNANITVDADGRLTAASSGSSSVPAFVTAATAKFGQLQFGAF